MESSPEWFDLTFALVEICDTLKETFVGVKNVAETLIKDITGLIRNEHFCKFSTHMTHSRPAISPIERQNLSRSTARERVGRDRIKASFR